MLDSSLEYAGTAQEPVTLTTTTALSRVLANRKVLSLVIFLVTGIVYARTLSFQFVYDDIGQIVDNPYVKSWVYFPRYFTENVWGQITKSGINYYRPLFLVWFRLNYLLFGVSPWGWHLTTILLHAACAVLVFKVADRITRNTVVGTLAGLVFGIHPVHIEGAAWVSGVTEPLMCAFLLAAFLLYLEKRTSREQGAITGLVALRSVGSVICFALALLSKETAIVLPLLIFIYAFLADTDGEQRSILARVNRSIIDASPYMVVSAIFIGVHYLALGALEYKVAPVPRSTVLLTAPSILWFYIRLLIFPMNLSEFYGLPYVSRFGFSTVVVPLLGVASVILVMGIWIRRMASRRDRRVAIFAALWLIIPVLLVLNISALSLDDFAHDRYLYLPSVGFSILLAMAVNSLIKGSARLFGMSAVRVVAAVLMCGGLAFGTVSQLSFWKDNMSLYSRAVELWPNSKIARLDLANELAAQKNYSDALVLYRQILAMDPGYWLADYNMGYAYYRLNQFPEAEQELRKTLQINSESPEANMYLGMTCFKTGRVQEAINHISRAIELNPNCKGYHFALGMIFETQGDRARALGEYKLETASHPETSAAVDRIRALEAH